MKKHLTILYVLFTLVNFAPNYIAAQSLNSITGCSSQPGPYQTTIAGNNIVVSPTPACHSGTSGTCATHGYRLGPPFSPQSAKFEFSKPVNRIRLDFFVGRVSASIRLFINGQPYTVKPSELSFPTCPNTIPNYPFTISGSDLVVTGPGATCAALGLTYNGRVDMIFSQPIDSIRVLHPVMCTTHLDFTIAFGYDTSVYVKQPFTDTLFCAGDSMKVNWTTSYDFRPGNNFTVQLSDANGSFATPVNIGSKASDTTDSVMCFVPANTPAGTGYKIRIVGTAPADTSIDTGIYIRVRPVPVKPAATANTPLCSGKDLNLNTVTTTPGVSYDWSGPGGFTSNIASPTRNATIAQWSGDYIVHTTLNGCTSRDTVNVMIQPSPAKPTAGSNSPVCVGGTLNLTASTVAGATYEWSGPAGFGTTQQNPARPNVLLTHGGKYSVVAKMNGCTSPGDTTMVVVNAGPQVGMYPNPGDTICTGWDVTFTATPQNAGANPTFDWYRNGAFTGNSGLTYKTNAVSHGDTFTVRMTSSACNTAIASKPVRMNVLPTQDPPAISIAATPGTHVWPWVEVTFKATTTKAGAKPGYQWKRNGADIPNGKDSILKMTDLKAGDTVCCVVTSNFLCAEPREVLSNCLVMNVDLSVGNQVKSTQGLRIYPNPTTGSFTLESKDAGTLVISNLQGQHIADYEVNIGIHRITLPQGLPVGVYIGKLNNEVVRVVVE